MHGFIFTEVFKKGGMSISSVRNREHKSIYLELLNKLSAGKRDTSLAFLIMLFPLGPYSFYLVLSH